MDVNAFFAENPRHHLPRLVCEFILLIGCGTASYLLPEPSIFIPIGMMAALALLAHANAYRNLFRQTLLYVYLDDLDRLRSADKEPKHHLRHCLRITRKWNGFQLVPFGPQMRVFRLRFLGHRHGYGIGMLILSPTLDERFLIRDWNSVSDLLAQTLRVLDACERGHLHDMIRRAYAYSMTRHANNRQWKRIRPVDDHRIN